MPPCPPRGRRTDQHNGQFVAAAISVAVRVSRPLLKSALLIPGGRSPPDPPCSRGGTFPQTPSPRPPRPAWRVSCQDTGYLPGTLVDSAGEAGEQDVTSYRQRYAG